MKKKIHSIEKVLNWMMVFVFCYAGCCLDSEGWIAYIVTAVSMLYLIIAGFRMGLFKI